MDKCGATRNISEHLDALQAAEHFMEYAQNVCGFGLMAVSLGYFDTLLSLSGSTTSSELSSAEKALAGEPCLCYFTWSLPSGWPDFETERSSYANANILGSAPDATIASQWAITMGLGWQ